MKTYTLILDQEVPTPVMRSLLKYLKSSGFTGPEEVNGGSELVVQDLDGKINLKLVLQNYIGSATVKEVKES